jgi:hypothetical protein
VSAQGGGLTRGGQAGSPLKFPEQVEQQQDAAKSRSGGEEFPQTRFVRDKIVF